MTTTFGKWMDRNDRLLRTRVKAVAVVAPSFWIRLQWRLLFLLAKPNTPSSVHGTESKALRWLDEHPVAGAGVQERHGSLGATPGFPVDELDARFGELGEGRVHVRCLEADVMEALAPALQEARDPGRVVKRLHELDLRCADAEEGDDDPV